MFGCIHVPDFPVQAAIRHESKAIPFALVDGPDSLLKVIACNALARNAGVSIGMTKLQAEVLCVTVRKLIQEDEDSAQAALLDCACNFSPRIEITSPGTIILDLAGSERLLGTGKPLAQLILGMAAARGFDCNICIAANPDTAHYAARGVKSITVIDPGDESQRLSQLQIEVLGLEPNVLETLHSWGIGTFKALAALPSIAITERLGQYGLHMQRLARGSVMRELTPADMPESFEEFTELEEAEELLEPLGFVLNRQLERMMMRLIERSLATDHLEITMALEVHPDREINASICAASKLVEYQRVVKLPVPTQDSKVLLKLLQLDLAAHPPEAPVKKIKIIATPARVRFAQAGLFQPLAPEPAKLEIAMARIRAVVGETDSQGRQKVGCPALLNSHRPDNFQVLPANGKHERTAVSIPHLALRRFRPAIPARVELGTKQAPMSVGFAQKRSKVLHASGPWRGGGEWWDAAGQWMREEWDVSLTIDGHEALYRIFLDLVSRTWFVDGSYD